MAVVVFNKSIGYGLDSSGRGGEVGILKEKS